MTGRFDPEFTAVFEETVRDRSGIFIDAGANLGYFSLLWMHFSGAGQSGPAHAFEMDPRSLKCLALTKARGGFRELTVHSCALGESPGRIRIEAAEEAGHTHIDYSEKAAGPWFEIRPLDSFLPSFAGTVSVIKIDVEGAELGVLRGASEVLRRHRPVVICEAVEPNLKRFGATTADLTAFMAARGYSWRSMGNACDENLVFTPLPESPAA